ncbi:uncharacterized protein LOC110038419 [Phalaenopsis equestris]|uniref:uncharacterized protein LOC110038419 n=1 Tax=Phalaenopsis equestris TaxID=78828 RepID=UPI0009E50167|nr:uncharacterized protein LOC110038419 [Phalaenopsis equestris]
METFLGKASLGFHQLLCLFPHRCSNLGSSVSAAQEAESKSFQEGFRGAWFRCKIKEISSRKGVLWHCLEYFDYPDEKKRWLKLYQKPPYANQGFGLHNKYEIMVRPRYPPFYRESELPDVLPESDVIVIVNDSWKVGDLVDWWCDGCFWSGRITQILGSDKVQIKLPDPPIGQGSSYEALCKDLRPSLHWSQENGWMVPLSGALDNGWYCAHLDWRYKKDAHRNYLDTADRENNEDVTADRVNELSSIDDNHNSFDDNDKNGLGAFKKSSTKEGQYTLVSEDARDVAALKYLMSATSSSTLESSIMNLEEVACRIRWLKGLLKFGFQWSDLMIPSWKFIETRKIHLRR